MVWILKKSQGRDHSDILTISQANLQYSRDTNWVPKPRSYATLIFIEMNEEKN
jgi:hypothetical protein